jgi:hypothetical protein
MASSASFTIVSVFFYYEAIALGCSMSSMLFQVHFRYLRSFFRGVQSDSEVTVPSPTRDRPPGAKSTHQQKCFCRRLTLFFFLHRTPHQHRHPSPISHRQHQQQRQQPSLIDNTSKAKYPSHPPQSSSLLPSSSHHTSYPPKGASTSHPTCMRCVYWREINLDTLCCDHFT